MIKSFLLRVLGRHRQTGIIPKEYIARFLPSHPIILEAGAETGSDTVEMARLLPDATIYAFEPVPASFSVLQRQTAVYPQVHCYNVGLSDEDAEVAMYVSNTLSSSSLLKPKEHLRQHPHISFTHDLAVQVVSIEGWAREQGVTKIDCLWLDLQGMELRVLQAARHLLRTVTVIYTEVSLVETYEGVGRYEALKTFLAEQGFEVVREELPWPDMGNVLFVKK